MVKIKTINKDQEGFASIVIALTMIIVLALLVVGFAQLARREQQSSLDKQLSEQAYYAAETGINDMRKLINSPDINDPSKVTGLNQDTCLSGSAINGTKDISTEYGVAYTCAVVKTLVKDIKFTGLLADTSKVTNFQATDSSGVPVSLASLTVKWTSEGATNVPGGNFLPASEWVSGSFPSVLQFSLTPYNSSAAERDTLIANTGTTYLYPATTDSEPSFSSLKGTGIGKISKADCSGNTCSVTIKGISASGDYLMHFINLYVKSDVVITGKDSAGNAVYFKGAQAMVDVTGKARNVLKRLQVRIPMDGNGSANLPGYALEAQNICKRMETQPSVGSQPSVTTFNKDGLAGSTTEKASCNLSTL